GPAPARHRAARHARLSRRLAGVAAGPAGAAGGGPLRRRLPAASRLVAVPSLDAPRAPRARIPAAGGAGGMGSPRLHLPRPRGRLAPVDGRPRLLAALRP